MHLWQNPTHTDLQTYRLGNPGIAEKFLKYLRLTLSSDRAVDPAIQATASQSRQDIELACTNGSDTGTNHTRGSSDLHSPSSSKQQDFRSSYVFLRTPKKLGEQLLPDDEDPPEAWGLYFEEGFRIHHFFIVVLFFYVLASLAFGLYWCIRYGLVGPHSGVEAFGISSWMITLVGLVTTVWFKWAD